MSQGSLDAVAASTASPILEGWSVRFRPETDADAPALRDLYGELRADELAGAPWTAPQQAAFLDDQFRLQRQHFKTQYAGADFWLIVGASDGEVVGRLYLDRSCSIWCVVDIGLVAGWRGQGLGGALIRWVQDEASRSGARGVDLHVALPNNRARALYERLGFRPVDEPLPMHQRMAWFS